MDKEIIIGKLKELQSQISELKERPVREQWGPRYRNWNSSLLKWLKLGLPHTQSEVYEIEHPEYEVYLVRDASHNYELEDQRKQRRYLERTDYLINSAIENIETGAVP